MLLEFKTRNYKSFVIRCAFLVTNCTEQKGLDYSIMKEKSEGKGN